MAEDPFVAAAAIAEAAGVQVEVLQDPECIELMTGFIAAPPDLWHEDIGV
jgi:cytosine/creatinine deaminase